VWADEVAGKFCLAIPMVIDGQQQHVIKEYNWQPGTFTIAVR
jgi:hypothetical protein